MIGDYEIIELQKCFEPLSLPGVAQKGSGETKLLHEDLRVEILLKNEDFKLF